MNTLLRSTITPFFTACAIALLICASATANTAQAPDPLALVQQGTDALNAAATPSLTEEEKQAQLTLAIAAYTAALNTPDYDHSHVRAALALAHAQQGSRGLAIAHARDALTLSPSSASTQKLLNDLRSQINTPYRAAPNALSRLSTAHKHIPPSIRLSAALTLNALGWLSLAAGFIYTIKTTKRLTFSKRLGVSSLILAALPTLSLIIQRQSEHNTPSAVVIGEAIIARTGPGDAGFPPSFDTPIEPGVELRIIESRNNWSLIELGTKDRAWLPTNALRQLLPAIK